MNLGENIYRFRTEKNMSQGDLADALEVSRQSVSKWENNSAVPELEKLMKMAQIFEITLDELVTGKEAAPPPPVQEVPAAPASTERFSARKIVGIVMLSLGLVCILVCTILAVMMGNLYEDDLISAAFILGAPLILIGILFLTVRHNVGYWCGTALYFGSWATLSVLCGDIGSMARVIFIPHLVLGLSLLIGTLLRIRSDKLRIPAWGKILLCVLLVMTLWGTALSVTSVTADTSVTVTPVSGAAPEYAVQGPF